MKAVLALIAAASLGLSGTAMAQAAAPAKPAAAPVAAAKAAPKAKATKAPHAATPSKPRTAVSIECSKQADAKGLHGKARESFRNECKKHGGK
ncbi:MAG: phosphate starvation-inducible protein PsiF [Proteobacteria bacterium]|nr:phosphate starvation-inducible protein PsiF [Pseudomonadota bacterium]